jgi:hypothetical protein
MNAPDTTNNAVQLQVDNGVATKIGDGGLTPNTWTWVDWKNGDVNNKTTMALTAGDRTFKFTGIEPNVKIDRVLVTDENCVPTGTGSNCTTIVTNPDPDTGTGSLNVNITSPLSNQTVKGVTKVVAAPSDNIQEVSFRINDVWQTTDDTAPFEWDWDTTKTANGDATVTIRARKVGDPGNVYTQKDVNVKVSNGTSTPTPPPADTQAPTKPTNFSAALRFDPMRFRYVMDLKWTAASDNVGVTNYEVKRDGEVIGEPVKTSFTDTSSLTAGTAYTYKVKAKDAMGNPSASAQLIVKGKCTLIWCSVEVL